MAKMFAYIPKQLLFVACMAGSLLMASDDLNLESSVLENVVASIYEDGFAVFVGNDAPALLATMKEICGLADDNDTLAFMSALVERLEQGHVVVAKEMMLEALDESLDILERHHTSIAQQDHLEQLVNTLSGAWDSIFEQDRWVSADDEDEIIRSGCCNDKSKRFCSIIAQNANIASLNVSGNEIVGGNVVINGTLSVGGVVFTPANGFVQNGNSFGVPALLGTNDAQPLAFATSGSSRMAISSGGAVSINVPATGSGLTVAGNATSIAATITPGTNQTGLSIGTSGIATGLSVFNSATVNAGVTYPLFIGGTQVGGGALATTVRGAPRMIWAQIPGTGAGSVTSQSGGVTTVAHTNGTGVYTITYDTFGTAPIVLATAGASNRFVATTSISTTSVVLEIRDMTGAVQDANFSLFIMGLAS